MFIFSPSQNKYLHFETLFRDSNFLHLTGIQLNKDYPKKKFYKNCLAGKLLDSDFDLKKDGTTVLKLSVLEQLMSIHKFVKMIGDYNNIKPLLYTEKLAGNISACLGFKLVDNYFVPVTSLKEDIRNISNKPLSKVIATYIKGTKDITYGH